MSTGGDGRDIVERAKLWIGQRALHPTTVGIDINRLGVEVMVGLVREIERLRGGFTREEFEALESVVYFAEQNSVFTDEVWTPLAALEEKVRALLPLEGE